MKLNLFVVLSFGLGVYCSNAGAATTCTNNNDSVYTTSGSITALPTLANSTTAVVNFPSDRPSGNLSGCTSSWAREQYFVDEVSDLSTSKAYNDGTYYYFKIKSVNGATSGDAATQYIIDHAYIAFTFNDPVGGSVSPPKKINAAAVNPGIYLLTGDGKFYKGSTGQGVISVGLSATNIQMYFDALPTNDLIIDALSTKALRIDVGKPVVEMTTPLTIDPNTTSTGVSKTTFSSRRVIFNINGIQFNKPTCSVPNQLVQLTSVTTSEFINSQTASPQNFEIQLNCNGYLNSRNFTLSLNDNNDVSNINDVGYLKNASGATYSNVGVQITDSNNSPISIGKSIDFLLNSSGTAFSKSFNASYYLPSGQASLGVVKAEATINISYP